MRWMRAWTARGFMSLAAVGAGCGGEANSTADAAVPADAQVATEGDPSRLVGTFTVTLVKASPESGTPNLSSMRGFVRDAPVPALTLWDPVESVGACILQTPRFPFCDPACGTDNCVEDDLCKPPPRAVDVGTVTVAGVQTTSGDKEFSLSKIGPSYQPPAAIDLTYPPAEEGAELRISTSGGDHAPFEVVSAGIAPLEVEVDGNIPFEPDSAMEVSWQPAGPRGASSIAALIDISHHGGARGRIVCEVRDADGRLEVDPLLVTGLIELGTAGYPTLKLTRRSVGSTTISLGRVDFSVEESRELGLSIPGLISCGTDSPCPEGQTCLPQRKCG